MTKAHKTSWESSANWYDRTVGEKGHYYHQHVILPKLLRLFDFSHSKNPALLDLACGQGILARHLPANVAYVGIDASASLIKAAKKYDVKRQFYTSDITTPLPISQKDFSHATVILALQNIADGQAVLKNAHLHLREKGRLFLVLNHPAFRIPRQSSWGIDQSKKLQYRRIDRYFSPLKIPIQTHPGQQESTSQTWTFHHPLSTYCHWLKNSGFSIELIDEWLSDKKSLGKFAAMENRSREEFPLFMTIIASRL